MTKHTSKAVSALVLAFAGTASLANAATMVDFEGGIAPSNITPGTPVVIDGFLFDAATVENMIFESGGPMVGNSGSYLGFAGGNTITITAPSPFSLESLDVAILSEYSIDPTTEFTITGFRTGMSDLVSVISSVSSPQNVTLNWTGLSSVTINTTTDSGIDNLSFNAVPEPSAAILLGLGALALTSRRQRTR